jgi:hypothetical protein
VALPAVFSAAMLSGRLLVIQLAAEALRLLVLVVIAIN